MLLDVIKTEKVLHRTQIDLKIVIFQDTIDAIRKSKLDKFQLYVFENIIKYHIESKLENDKEYKEIRTYFIKLISNLPKVKTDGRIKIGEYNLFSNLKILVRSSKLFKEQILEIIYKE